MASLSGPYKSAVAFRDATEPGDVYVSLDVRGGRRIADPRELGNTFVSATLTLGYFASKELELSISPKLKARWYPDYFGDFRRDLRPGVLAKAVWTPEWLTRIVPRSEIVLSANFYRNYSNLPDKNYTFWEIGPTLGARWRF